MSVHQTGVFAAIPLCSWAVTALHRKPEYHDRSCINEAGRRGASAPVPAPET